jgi:long-chain acyl-CoA synthetase
MVMLERRDAVNRAIKRFIEETPTTWRDTSQTTKRSVRIDLRNERPWLNYYEDGVPYTICLPNIPLHRLLRSAVRRYHNRTALSFEGKRLSYRRLNHAVNRFANTLIERGIDKGDRVMLLLPNIPQAVIGFYGVLKAGAVAVFSLPLNKQEELVRQVADSGARVLVTLNQYREVAMQALEETQLEQVIFTSAADYLPITKKIGLVFNPQRRQEFELGIELKENMSSFKQELAPQSPKSPEMHISPDDLAVIIYTGGTTAAPKGVMLTHRNLVANILQTRHWMPEAEEGHERFLCAIPFSHSYGLTAALNVGISVGATLILKARFDTEDVLKVIKKHKPTIFPGVPHMYVAISNFRGVRKYKISSIQACISGAAPLPVEVQESFEKLTRGRLVEGYGLTEAGPVTHANPLNGRRKVGSIGIPMPSTEARVVSLTAPSQVCPVEQIGELAVRGPQVMRGYWNNELATQKVLLPDGWLLTGDVAQVDRDGYFRIIARKADMWYPDKPGDPAFPRDVEEVLFEVPQVKEAAVKEKPSAESLIAYCKRRLPPELVPRLIIFVDDFPRSLIGKVLRRELAKKYEQDYAER